MNRKLQRNFETDTSTEEKLFKLKEYHGKSFNQLYKLMVEEMFLRMEENTSVSLADQIKQLRADFNNLVEVLDKNIELKYD